jgi:glycosyltransferase involved in cell wall biosynthesis
MFHNMTKTPLAILIVTHHYPPQVSGIGNVAYQHAKYLASVGHQVMVVTSTAPHGSGEEPELPGVRVERVSAWSPLERMGVPFPLFSPRLVPVLYRAVRSADVVHVHDVFYISSLVAAFWAYLFHRVVVLLQHVDMIEHPRWVVRFAQRMVYATAGRFIFFVSTYILTLNDRVRSFVRRYGVPEHKLIDIVNGVNMELFHPGTSTEAAATRKKYGLRTDVPLVLFVGRFVPKKGFDVLVRARGEGYQIACVGGTTTQPSDEQVAFLGECSAAEVAALYRAADLFVLPSVSEGFPLSVQEAMASSVPVVITRDEGYERYRFDDAGIYFLREPSVEAVRVAITTLMSDVQRRKAMATYARTYAQEHFSWSQVGVVLEGVYHAARRNITSALA